jgi:hypothetical protein
MATALGPEITVAEGTRQARIAKAVREAKEKAESDNRCAASVVATSMKK